ncbi:MAG: PAS domain-containing sensor histidine kinase [Candidatus Thermoplasmatota archaeon]|nr:PAS domain-containing sensor histidine kinase [Candidatus Thermoplasmatota archaeon]
MKNEPDIVKELRKQENIEKLRSASQNVLFLENDDVKKQQMHAYSNDERKIAENKEITCCSTQLSTEVSKEIHELIFQSTNDIIAFLDLRGCIIKINNAVVNFCGYCKEDIVGKYFWKIPDLIPEKFYSMALKVFKNIIFGEHLKNFNFELYDKTHKKHKMCVSTYPVKENNKMKYILVIGKDITKDEENLEKYRNLVERANDGILFLKDTIVQYANPRLAEMWGGTVEEVIGTPFTNYVDLDEIPKVIGLYKRRMAGEQVPTVYKTILRGKDGSKIYAEVNAGIISHEGSSVDFVIVRNITHEKLSNDKIRESQERFKMIFESANDVMVYTDIRGNFLEINKKIKDVFGYEPDELIGKNVLINRLFKLKDIARLKKQLKAIVRKGDIIDNTGEGQNVFELEIRHKNGKYGLTEVRTSVVKKENKLVGFLSILRDVTEQRIAEKKLRESEERYRIIFESAADGIAFIDTRGVIRDINKIALQVTGYSRDDLVGKNIKFLSHIITKDTLPLVLKNNLKRKMGVTVGPYEMKIVAKTGKIHHVEVNAVPLNRGGKKLGFLAILRDITERKKAEEALAERERQYRTLFERAHDMIHSVDKRGHFLFVNPAWKAALGYSDEEISKLLLTDIIHKDSLPHFIDIFSRVIGGEKMENIETKFVTKDETVIYVEGKISARYVDGKIVGTEGIFRDNTKRKLAEDALRKSEKRFRDLAELLPEVIFEADLQGRITYINQKAFEIFECKTEDLLIGLPISSIVAPEYLQKLKDNYSKILSGKFSSGNEYVFIKKDGTRIPMMIFSAPIYDGDTVIGTRGVAVDLTKLKKAYNEIEALLKMKNDFINQLGHDLKTPLSPLINLLPLIREKEQDPKSQERLDVAISCVNYIKDLVVNTIEVAKLSSDKISFNTEDVNLFKIMQTIIDRNKPLFDEKNITLENNILNNVIVKADALRLEEVLNNIVSNAVKYMSVQNGRITFDAKKKQDQVLVSIKDTGVGLAKDQLELIFNEFYKCDTSRHDPDSTGLGLSICKRLIEKQGGCIWAESPGIGKGSTFFFTLPIGEGKNT